MYPQSLLQHHLGDLEKFLGNINTYDQTTSWLVVQLSSTLRTRNTKRTPLFIRKQKKTNKNSVTDSPLNKNIAWSKKKVKRMLDNIKNSTQRQ